MKASRLAEKALSGRGDRIVIVREIAEAEVRYANNTVTTNGTRRDRHVSVVRFDGERIGTASGSGALPIEELVAKADSDAASSEPAEDAFELVGPGEETDFEDEPEVTGLRALSPVIGALEGVFDRAEQAERVMAGFARHRVVTTYLASSTGLRYRFVQPDGSVELVGRSSDGTRSSWAGSGTNWFEDVALAELEDKVVRGLDWARRKLELPAGRYETLLPGDAVADLVVMLDSGLSGREAEEGRTVFSRSGGGTRVGDRLSELGFNLYSDPHEPGLEAASRFATGSSSVDQSVFDNGLPLGRTAWIEDGELRRLRYHRAGAARSGVEPAPESSNVVLELPGATGSIDDLVARTERGLLLTCLWYIREVDPATMLFTGLTRDGVYLVEHGEVVGAVNNFRFNESPVDMLARTVEAGATTRAFSREWGDWVTRTAMPPVRVDGFNMSSVTPAN